jgi:cell division septum initiation protein DivIVA
LNQIEEIILDSPRILFTGRTLVDEETLLDHLDLIRMNLPGAFTEAREILNYKEEILLEAEKYAQDIIEAAQQRANEILDESNLMRAVQSEAEAVRQQVQQECEELQRKTWAQAEQSRQQTQQEVQDLRQLTLNECEEIYQGAEEYADSVLDNLEGDLVKMLTIIRNGRQQLYQDKPSLPES